MTSGTAKAPWPSRFQSGTRVRTLTRSLLDTPASPAADARALDTDGEDRLSLTPAPARVPHDHNQVRPGQHTEEDACSSKGCTRCCRRRSRPPGDVDDDSLRRVVDLFIGAGVNGVTVLGVTGEVARLDDGERQRVLEIVTAHVNGRIGVVAGTTAEGTRTCIGYSRAARAAGATAVMVSPPRMPKLNSDAVRAALPRAGGGCRRRDCRAGLPADLRLCDGAVAAGADRQGDSARAHHQARGSADAVQDRRASSSRRPASTCGSSAASAACSCSRS